MCKTFCSTTAKRKPTLKFFWRFFFKSSTNSHPPMLSHISQFINKTNHFLHKKSHTLCGFLLQLYFASVVLASAEPLSVPFAFAILASRSAISAFKSSTCFVKIAFVFSRIGNLSSLSFITSSQC